IASPPSKRATTPRTRRSHETPARGRRGRTRERRRHVGDGPIAIRRQDAGPMSTGEGDRVDVAALADLLREAEQHHGAFEASAPKHSWADWYAPYIRARLDGTTSDEAVESADQYMRDNFNVVRR